MITDKSFDSLNAQIKHAQEAAQEIARIDALREQANSLDALLTTRTKQTERETLRNNMECIIADVQPQLPAIAGEVLQLKEMAKEIDKLYGEFAAKKLSVTHAIGVLADETKEAIRAYNDSCYVAPTPYEPQGHFEGGGCNLVSKLQQAGFGNPQLVMIFDNISNLDLSRLLQAGGYFSGMRSLY